MIKPIILLLGSSTAGKSTICAHKAFKDFYKTGYDLGMNNVDIIIPFIKKVIVHLYNCHEHSNLVETIINSQVNKDSALATIASNIQDFNTSCVFTKSFLIDIEKHPYLFSKMFNLCIFENAASNALQGKPVILDMIPDLESQYDMIELFKESLVKYNLEGTIVLVHVDVEILAARIMQRNNDPMDQRIGMFPFLQYTSIFNKKGEGDTNPTITTITPQKITNAIGPLKAKYNLSPYPKVPYSEVAIWDFMIKMGFTKEQITMNQEIEISPAISSYDILIHNTADNRDVNISKIYNVAFERAWHHIFECWKCEHDIWQKCFEQGSIQSSLASLVTSDYEEINIFTKYDRTQINYNFSDFLGGDALDIDYIFT